MAQSMFSCCLAASRSAILRDLPRTTDSVLIDLVTFGFRITALPQERYLNIHTEPPLQLKRSRSQECIPQRAPLIPAPETLR